MRNALIAVIVVCTHMSSVCDEPTAVSVVVKSKVPGQLFFTGNPRIDFFSGNLLAEDLFSNSTADVLSQTTTRSQAGGKSPWLAASLSAAVPGSGEFYSKSYLKSAIFFGAEVATWIVYGVYTKRGNDRTDEYEDFANVHWSVVDYALWMNQYKDCSIAVDPNTNLPLHQRVDWNPLNMCERSIQGFSHLLPPFDTQQYYELIGKYAQYTPGWDDADPTIDYALRENLDKISSQFGFYRDMRGDANELLDVARVAVNVVVLNHVLSTLDAAWSASRYNRSLQASARVQIRRLGAIREIVPTIDVKLSF